MVGKYKYAFRAGHQILFLNTKHLLGLLYIESC